jgi:hypothetical protein
VNPFGRQAPGAQNDERRRDLEGHLASCGLAWHPAVGGDPDGDHLEPGCLVLDLDLRTAAELGARFEQAAVYLWDAAALHLVACHSDRHDVLGYRVIRGTNLPRP